MFSQRNNFLRLKWLCNVILCPGQAAFQAINNAITTRDHDNNRVLELWLYFQTTGKFVAVHLGKTNIEHYQVGNARIWPGQPAYRIYPIREAFHFKAFSSQARFYYFSYCI